MRFALPVFAFAGLLWLAPRLNAQTIITSVDPPTAKAGDMVSAKGQAIDQGNVDELYLTNGKDDIRVQISEQSDKVIKFKIPSDVKPGRWALMIHTKGAEPRLMEQPVKVTVE